MFTSRDASTALLIAALALIIALLGGALAHAGELGFLGESMFDRLDTNHDGILSKDEARAARGEMFDRIDADHDGVVTVTEIEAAKARAQERGIARLARMAKLRAEMAPPSERLAEFDTNHDGKISRAEFLSANPWFDRVAKTDQGISKSDLASFLDGAN